MAFRTAKQLPLFGVFDGHGSDGKGVSNYLKHRIPLLVNKFLNKSTSKISDILSKSVVKADADLKKTTIDWFSSGSTLWMALIKGQNIFIGKQRLTLFIMLTICNSANTGDSKAMLFQYGDPENSLSAAIERLKWVSGGAEKPPESNLLSYNCTNEHNFDDDNEYRRILCKPANHSAIKLIIFI